MKKAKQKMNSLKRLGCILILLAIMLSISGCYPKANTYPFQQSTENITRIDLLVCGDFYVAEENYEIFAQLYDDEMEQCIKELSELNCYRYFNDPATGYSNYAVKIYYADGEYELIGSNNNRYTIDGEIFLDKYYFLDDEFMTLFKYYMAE